ncbi:hypothetical protein C0991_008804 [Blastosporella zonata]|nr:hypothetical protein C0991_008804 [Blastosporella zonata]
MSFGRPPSINVGFKTSPPDRGSFPLDHYGPSNFLVCGYPKPDQILGECKGMMTLYMKCMRDNESTSTLCREMSKNYLECRMSKGLMERDEWGNLGMANLVKKEEKNTTLDKDSSS